MPFIPFTSQNAREMQAKAVESRKLRQRNGALTIAQATQLANGEFADYQIVRLARVQRILDDLDKRAANTDDPTESAKLGQAAKYWHDQHQELAMIPKPGSYRPTKKQSNNKPIIPEPVD